MSDLSDLFDRDPLSLNTDGTKGLSTRELETIIAYFREARAKNMLGKAPKAAPKAGKIDLGDLDV